MDDNSQADEREYFHTAETHVTSLDANNRRDDDSYSCSPLWGEITNLATLNGKTCVAEFFSLTNWKHISVFSCR